MIDSTVSVLVSMLMVLLAGAVPLARRLRRQGERRAEAERRAAQALEELGRLSQELRRRSEESPPDPSVPPGLRLIRQYPGVTRRPGRGTPGAES